MNKIQCKRFWALCLCSLLIMLGASACSKSEPGPNPGAIVPGVGVKEISLGQTRADVVKALGNPDTEEANPFNAQNIIVEYYAKGLEISYDGDVVGNIVIHPAIDKWSAYQGSTSQGAWVMSNRKDIKKLQGTPMKELDQALIYQGLWVRLNADGSVESFSIGS